jgi:hypothetical protein
MGETQTTEERIYRTLAAYTEKAAAREIAAELEAKDKRIAEQEQQLSTCTEKRDKDLDVTVETPAIRVVSFAVLADDFDLGQDIMPTLDNIARRLLMRWIFGGDKIRTEMLGIPEGEPIL